MYETYSVLMSVYCKENPTFLDLAMDSMWRQTIPTDDFILVCDGMLSEELNTIIDCQIKAHSQFLHVIQIKTRKGLGNALNEGLKYCKNTLVARMDSDDISMADRCEKQLSVFQTHPEISLCSGTVLEFFNSINNVVGKRELPSNNNEIRAFSKKRNPFNHPAVMFKKSDVIAAGGYSEKYELFEDYFLWIRMLMKGSIALNITSPLLYMRISENTYIRRGGKKYAKNMLSFHRWLYFSGWTTFIDYFCRVLPHAVVCILPNAIRRLIYTKFLR